MPRRLRRTRRAVVLVLCAGTAVALAGCDSGGSSSSAPRTSSTTRRARRRHPSSTTRPVTSSTSAAGTSATSATTGPDTAPTEPTTNPPATADCGAQAAHLAAVVDQDLTGVDVARYTISDCRLAPSNPIWAAVTLVPKPGETVPGLTVVFERVGSIWDVHSHGEGATGCDAPAPVPTELRLGC